VIVALLVWSADDWRLRRVDWDDPTGDSRVPLTVILMPLAASITRRGVWRAVSIIVEARLRPQAGGAFLSRVRHCFSSISSPVTVL
jgi:hypothetical protein